MEAMKPLDLTKPLPCPFCGEPAEVDLQRGFIAYDCNPGQAVAIYCCECPADMTLCRDDFPSHSTEELYSLLLEKWNKRTA